MTYRYIRASGVRALVKEHGKRCGGGFLDGLNRLIEDKVIACCIKKNGGKKTLSRYLINSPLL